MRVTDAGRGRWLTALAAAAATVSVVLLLVTTAVATQRFRATTTTSPPNSASPSSSPAGNGGVEYPSTPPLSASAFPGGQLVYGDTQKNAVFEVPARTDAWTVEPDVILGLEAAPGTTGPNPVVRSPASYDQGYCKAQRSLQRAYVGLGVSVESDDVAGSNTTILESWRAALADSAAQAGLDPPVVRPQRRVTLHDGTAGWLSSVAAAWEPDACEGPKVVVSVLSLDTGRFITSVVGFRYVAADGLSAADLETILMTTRLQRAA